jgi:transcriptional regulator with GAF, ATPase, and Fis domain
MYDEVVGQSEAMRSLLGLLPRIAASESTVLLEGETGTGKGLLAEAIHRQSARRRGPLVVVDCSSIPPTLIEAELFGHARGAFTGAHAGRAGAFEAARGGTVFLDEIGELPLEMQPKLLRALEEREVKPVGSTVPVRLDVRVLAATHRDLRREVDRGAFRADLFYRLHVFALRVPSLRERREDIPLLIRHFLGRFAPDGEEALSPELYESLLQQDWPGNVRELRSAVERLALLGESMFLAESARGPSSGVGLRADSAPPPEPAPTNGNEEIGDDAALSFRVAKEQAVARWERTYLGELIQRSDHNLSAAARLARMDRSYLRDLLKRHGLHLERVA